MTSADVIAALKRDGWYLNRVSGSHHQFRHPTKPGTTTVPHPRRELAIGTVKSIEKQAQLKIR
jgi:predicted RNA binding protein YcfA (HicA-like mRNA interferase family)